MLRQPIFQLLKIFIGIFKNHLNYISYCSDGGLIANNPTVELMTEFFRYKAIMECYERVKFY